MAKLIRIIRARIINHERGAVLVTAIFILAVLVIMGISLVALILSNASYIDKTAYATKAMYFAESGVDKAIYEINQDSGYTGGTTSLEDGKFDIQVADESASVKVITATGFYPQNPPYKAQRTIRVKAEANPDDAGISFRYAIQSGVGGFELENNAVIDGTVFTSGNIVGQNKNQSRITGDAWAGGTIDTVTVQTRGDGTGGNAHVTALNKIVNSVIQQNSYTDFTDEPLPSIDLTFWKDAAEAGGVITGDYTPPDYATLGPKKIDGNLNIGGGNHLTITGPIWVTKNITFGNNSIVTLSDAFGDAGTLIIADHPTDDATFGKAVIGNGTIVSPNASGGLLLLLASNTSMDQSNPAIKVENSSTGIVYYALDGMLYIYNNAVLKAGTAKKIRIKENAEIHYEMGLASAKFSTGPGGGWRIKPHSWETVNP